MDETAKKVDAGGREETYIALQACEVGYLYYIDGRNSCFGVYKGDGEFLLRRYKFGDIFIDSEDHWDKDNGTVKPLRKLERVPFELNARDDGPLLAWLEEQRKRNIIEEEA